LLAAVVASAAGRGATPFMVLLAVQQALLARLGGQRDITVGTPVLGRDRREFQSIVGRFVNYVGIRTDVDPALGFDALLDRVRVAVLAAFAHRDVPLEHLQGVLRPGEELLADPWFRAVLVLHNGGTGELALPGLTLTRRRVARAAARYDLELHVWPTGDGAEVQFLRNTAVLDPGTGTEFAEDFVTALKMVTARPGIPVGDLPGPRAR
ncbi:condensation domain-containing protein, partial [Streptomyces sp. W16]|uniref:condensation domain-containing protein n=1 Tax=Streptomyces sp. W16 TaxID=3076631 RepID=UPI00295B4D02